MFIDNPALQLTRDWIFDLKKGSCTWPDRACMKVDVSVYCRLLLRPEKLTKTLFSFLAVAVFIFDEKILHRNLWRVLSKIY